MSLMNIVKKEVKELLTPATIVPVIVIALVFSSMGNMMGGIEEELEEKPVIGVIDQDDGIYSDIALSVLRNNSKIVYSGTDLDEGVERLTADEGTALLKLNSNFTWNIENNITASIQVVWIMRGAGIMDSISSEVINSLIGSIDTEISKTLIERNGEGSSKHIMNPVDIDQTTIFKGKEMVGVSPSTISGMLSSQSIIVPIVTMMLILMAGGTVISSMGMEKEDKTLETLMTLPINRSYIVLGKLLGSAVIGLIMATVYMVGFGYYMQGMQNPDLNLAEYGLSLGVIDYVLVGISLFLALVAGLALSLIFGTFAKNYKSAQTLLFPVTALAMIPMFVFMFTDFNTLPLPLKGVMFAIPFSHPILAMRSLMFNDYLLVISGIIYTAVFSIALIMIAVWIFNSDRLITGKVGKKEGLMDKLAR
ncbi:MAG: ABC transporter permease [Thermoplasmatota archaeon]